jgi:hypothetical protein
MTQLEGEIGVTTRCFHITYYSAVLAKQYTTCYFFYVSNSFTKEPMAFKQGMVLWNVMAEQGQCPF